MKKMSITLQRYYVPQTNVTQKIDATTSAQTSAFSAGATVRVIAPDGAYMQLGVDPTATNTKMYLAPEIAEIVQVPAGHKIAFLAIGTDKNVYVTPLGL